MADMFESHNEHSQRNFSVSEAAINRIAQIMETESDKETKLRVSVSGGGCSGFQYGFSLDSITNADDHLFTKNNIEVIVDEISLEYLSGSELDYVQDLIGSYFSIKNPNASSTCGCGTSFAI